MQEKTYEMTLLYDFYSDLLTEKQRYYFERFYNDDLTLSEIAENEGISRQGVRDILMRAEITLRQLEDKTGVVKRFCEMRNCVNEINALVKELIANTEGHNKALAEGVYKRLQFLKE